MEQLNNIYKCEHVEYIYVVKITKSLELQMTDWAALTRLYDDLAAAKATKRCCAPKSSSGASKEWSSKWIEYATNQINSERLRSTWTGTVTLNLAASDDHIANVILRQYKHLIHPFRTPFQSSEAVPEAVWQAMKAKVVECREYHALWIATEREEMWNRPLEMYMTRPVLVGLTGLVLTDPIYQPTTSVELIHKGAKKVPVLRIQLGVK